MPRRPAAAPLAALCAALFVVFALVAPVLAAEGPTKLFDPQVSPRTGSPTTTIKLTVSYRNHEGSAPEYVSVVIDGKAHPMTPSSGTNWKSGVANHYATTLAAGTHTISFTAMSRDRFSDTVAGGTVTITKPTSPSATPKPTPTPTPRPDPTPVPEPTSTAGTDGAGGSAADGGSGSGSTGGDATTGGTGTGTQPGTDSRDSADPSMGPGAIPGGIGATGGGDGSNSAGPDGTFGSGGAGAGAAGGEAAGGTGAIGPDGLTHGTDGVSGAAAGPTGGASGSGTTQAGGPGWGALASALEALGIKRPPALTMLPMLVGTSTAMTMAFAFAIFGKKRRDEEPPAPDEVLKANAARGHNGVPGSEVVNGVMRGATVLAPLDLEAGMPRWRRPSLLEARKADPTRSVATPHRMSFDNGVVGPVEGHERRVIRYAVVRLLDAPDELRSAEIGQLDQGDEVQLIEQSGSYWLVLCPDGRQGWLHRMTLGEVVTDDAPSAYGRDIDDDVLSAYLTARAHA